MATTRPTLARAAERAGHQVIVHVPMEPEGSEDPGPDGAAHRSGRRAKSAPSRLGAVARAGLCRHQQSHGQPLHARIGRADPGDGAAGRARRLLSRLAHDAALASSFRWRVPSASPAPGATCSSTTRRRGPMSRRSWPETERVARETGVAIAIGHPHDVTLAALKAWTARAGVRGYRLVPSAWPSASRRNRPRCGWRCGIRRATVSHQLTIVSYRLTFGS